MIWERRIALCLTLLALLLLGRMAWLTYQEKALSPAFIDEDLPLTPIYFSSADAKWLLPEFRKTSGSIEDLIWALIKGPTEPGLAPVLPEGVELLDYALEDSLLVVNFSHHLISAHPGGSRGEMMTVYGIVNTLVGVAGIEDVQILVEGERVATLVGHLFIGKPLKKDYTLLGSFPI
ncbi:MAG TPA: GerMN domain-containing protein [Firmicutes bacterium]|nr:GerMN domain-containing protein [Bacillota bacterium]